ncbi:GNAT family N-acetyltransferase [uncultured Pelagimonas sp.]|uniref:GNAT family N-acetyltransferase n=1 Tax=uncultured Pelagimonas sp. TaxID=1618102 RepID=UPI00262C6592|nr:GNAT family N-acetyltransferase [uncultured Pelagimonas sp.]
MTDLRFDTATLAELETALSWAAREGWNPGQDDAQAFMAADPDGFFVARVAGEIIAAISVVNHSETMAFLGLYLCKPDFRGQGVGFALWRHALRHAGKRCVGLDGVAEQEPNYAKSDFVRTGATTRLQGKAPKATTEGTRAFDAARDFAAVATLDRCANGYHRSKFLAQWVAEGAATRKTVVLSQNGKVSGFATIRLCQQGAKVGPITAPDIPTALALLSAAAATFDVTDVTLDLPSSAIEFREALEGRGFVKTFETARMYCGTAPEASSLNMAIATMELG